MSQTDSPCCRLVCRVIVIVAALSLPPALLADTAQYYYDELGRLVGVVNDQGDAAVYNYDAVGNLLTIQRFTSSGGGVGLFLIAPGSSLVNTPVEIRGFGFTTPPSSNQVQFNGVTAAVVSGSGTSLIVTVPAGATSGPVTVTNANGPAASPNAFTVLVPPIITGVDPPKVPQGTTARVHIAGFNLATASAVQFTQAGLTATILSGGTDATLPVNVTVHVLASGITTLTGLVLDEDDQSVAGALVTLGAMQVSTDGGGNFLMQNTPAGAEQLLLIDGGPASTPQHSLPVIPYKVTIVASQANALSFVPHLHFQKTTGMVDISNSGVERVVTDPTLPGFQMTIPAGAVITGWDGQLNTQISIRRVPLDRLPVPPPPADRVGTAAYMDYFGKPGGGTPSEPIPITLPNDLDLPPGAQAELWYYDEAPDGSRPNQWAQYGTGTVSPDGYQIVPDLDPATGKPYSQPRFCCGINMALILQTAWNVYFGGGSPSAGGETGGDPVDLATGLLTVAKTDMVLSGRVPVVLTRTYRTNGTDSGPFGRGTAHTYQVTLGIQSNQRILLLGDGRRFALTQQPDGSYRNQTDGLLQGAVLTEPGGVPTLRWKDGVRWTFTTPSLNLALLAGQADRNGNAITLTRIGTQITAITGPDGRQLTLSYDGSNRITRITDPIGRFVLYAYDGAGNLATVIDPEGGTTRYEYDSANRMGRIIDPKGIPFLQNFYGPSGRVLGEEKGSGVFS